jgi:hypothetical protein
MRFVSLWRRRLSPTPPIRRTRPEIEALEARALPTVSGFEPIGGVGNNLLGPTLGAAGTDLLRVSPAAYADGVSAPSLPQDQSARVISNILNDQTDPNDPSQDLNTVNGNSLTDFGYVWGQFIDHDMDLTPTGSGESFPITAAAGDPVGTEPFTRSSFDPATGTSTSDPRQQVNAVSSFLDLSQVYGSTQAVADALRTHSGGLLKTSPGNLLPYNNLTYFTQDQLNALNMANDSGAVPNSSLFAAGDVRANENVELTALQTLFVRNHNRLAAALQQEHPDWTDEQLYQEARKLNIAEYQMITYTEYLPDLLGAGALPKYTGYNPNVDPAIATEFSTVAFRFGHSMLDNGIDRLNNNGTDITDPSGATVDLAQDFFDPNLLGTTGAVDPLTGHVATDIGAILKGDASGVAQAVDPLAVRDVRDLLFGNGGQGGQDLIARDVQRARDDGIGSYNQVREAYGLPPVTSFAQITSNVKVQQELQQAYGSVDNIDPFEGGLAEDHVKGSDVGPLFQAIMVDQFTRLRNGDRFFYLNESWTPDELRLLGQGNTLAKVIEDNTDITNLQSDVMVFKASISGTVSLSTGGSGHHDMRTQGVAGATVQLLDSGGNVVGTTTTDSKGRYTFDQQNGLGGTGTYTVSLVVPSGDTQASANPGSILISRGGVNVRDVNFVVAPAGQGTTTGTGSSDSQGASAGGDQGQTCSTAGTTSTSDSTGTTADQGTTTNTGGSSGTTTDSQGGSSGSGQGQACSSASTTTTSGSTSDQGTTTMPGAATHFAVITTGPALAGFPAAVELVALDASNHVATGYTGTVHFTSSDAGATLPADYTFTAADNGSHLFSVTFAPAGKQTLTATDSTTATITASLTDRVFAQLGLDDLFSLRHFRR